MPGNQKHEQNILECAECGHELDQPLTPELVRERLGTVIERLITADKRLGYCGVCGLELPADDPWLVAD
jgi:hypothetical protein